MNAKDKICASGMECMVGWATQEVRLIHYLAAVTTLSMFFIF